MCSGLRVMCGRGRERCTVADEPAPAPVHARPAPTAPKKKPPRHARVQQERRSPGVRIQPKRHELGRQRDQERRWGLRPLGVGDDQRLRPQQVGRAPARSLPPVSPSGRARVIVCLAAGRARSCLNPNMIPASQNSPRRCPYVCPPSPPSPCPSLCPCRPAVLPLCLPARPSLRRSLRLCPCHHARATAGLPTAASSTPPPRRLTSPRPSSLPAPSSTSGRVDTVARRADPATARSRKRASRPRQTR